MPRRAPPAGRELRQPLGVVVDVEAPVRVAAEHRGEGERAFDPAHHGHVVAHPLAQEADGLQPVAHAPAVLGLDELQGCRVLGRLQADRPAQGQGVLRPLDVEAQVGRLAVGVGDRLDDVEVEGLEDGQVRLHEHPVVEVVARERTADVVGRPLHVDVEVGRAVDRLAAGAEGAPLERLHGAEDTPEAALVIPSGHRRRPVAGATSLSPRSSIRAATSVRRAGGTADSSSPGETKLLGMTSLAVARDEAPRNDSRGGARRSSE